MDIPGMKSWQVFLSRYRPMARTGAGESADVPPGRPQPDSDLWRGFGWSGSSESRLRLLHVEAEGHGAERPGLLLLIADLLAKQ